jgi:hypothetical protein
LELGGPIFSCEKDQGGAIFADDPFNDISILKIDDVTLNVNINNHRWPISKHGITKY